MNPVDFPILVAIIATGDEYMEMVYIDSNALAKRYIKEEGSEKIDSLLVEG